MKNTMAVPRQQPHTLIPGDEMDKIKIRLVLAEERKIGNTVCRVYRPVLTEEQRKQRMKKVYRAVAACLREM